MAPRRRRSDGGGASRVGSAAACCVAARATRTAGAGAGTPKSRRTALVVLRRSALPAPSNAAITALTMGGRCQLLFLRAAVAAARARHASSASSTSFSMRATNAHAAASWR